MLQADEWVGGIAIVYREPRSRAILGVEAKDCLDLISRMISKLQMQELAFEIYREAAYEVTPFHLQSYNLCNSDPRAGRYYQGIQENKKD